MNTLLQNIFAGALMLGTVLTAFSQTMNPDFDTPRPIDAKDTVYIEAMTWMEVRDAMADGKTTAIIATGGVEQNGPYIEAGAHQVILSALTDRIARKLGNALVAPVISYVPEGDIEAPTSHMLYPSTLSVSEETFQAILTDAANSLRVHGFEHIVLIGDSGGNQKGMDAVAEKLSKSWNGKISKFGKAPKIHYIKEFYNNARWNRWLVEQGYEEGDQKIHDDLRHEAIMMTVDLSTVRFEQRKQANLASINGISILDTDKLVDLGNRLADYHADVTVEAIQAALKE
jgi:creatinine amidohydrolase